MVSVVRRIVVRFFLGMAFLGMTSCLVAQGTGPPPSANPAAAKSQAEVPDAPTPGQPVLRPPIPSLARRRIRSSPRTQELFQHPRLQAAQRKAAPVHRAPRHSQIPRKAN